MRDFRHFLERIVFEYAARDERIDDVFPSEAVGVREAVPKRT